MNAGRHDPMPDVSRLPGWLWRRSPRSVKLAIGMALVAGVALGIALAPGIRESKDERGRAEREAAAARRAQRLRDLRAEQRPVTGTLPAAGVEAAVLADARRRVRRAELRRPVRRAECDPLSGRRHRYACLAVTASIPAGELNEAGAIGYPYRALIDPARRRYALCKISGKAGEGALTAEPVVPVPRACGGDT